MAPVRALTALAAFAALSGANAVVYNYNNGGQDWGEITGNAKCSSGTNQSPINVPASTPNGVSVDSTLQPLNIKYGKAASWALEVTPNYLEVADIDTVTTGTNLSTANTFTDGLTLADGTFVPLNQFHFHTPSEHTINGMHFPLEMHMVHKLYTSDGTLTGTRIAPTTNSSQMARAAVIGIMFAYDPVGNDGTFMSKLSPLFNKIKVKGADTDDTTGTSDADALFDLEAEVFGVIGNTDYFTYSGSLTTPGCTEGITWFLMQNPMYASPQQILDFTSVLATEQGTMGRGSDNRLVQPLNTRTVYSSVPLS